MMRLPTPETTPAAEDLKQIARTLHFGNLGVPNFLKVLSQSAAAMNAYVLAENALTYGQLSQRQREAIALTVAEINGARYCLALHQVIGREAGLDEGDIWLARKASARDPKTEAMLHLVQDMVIRRGEVSDADFEALRQAGCSESEIIEVVANTALNIFANYFALALGTKIDKGIPAVELICGAKNPPVEETS